MVKAKTIKLVQENLENEGVDGHVPDIHMGTRIRHARLTRGARLLDIAEAADCSESLVSKIENNKANPSLKILRKICHALGMTLGDFFAIPEDGRRVVTTSDQRPVMNLDPVREGNDVRLETLVPFSKGYLLQGNIHIIEPGGTTGGLIHHQGEEVGYVLSGELELYVGNQTCQIAEGDSFVFRSEIPHGYSNKSNYETRVIFINTPPTY